MSYSIGERVVYRDLNGKEIVAKIYLRKIDNPQNFINAPHHKGGFDYVIKYKNNSTDFCQEAELRKFYCEQN